MPLRRDLLAATPALLARPDAPAMPPALPSRPLPLGNIAVVGTRYHDAPLVAPFLTEAASVILRREPHHPRDPWAVSVHAAGGERLGYLPRENRLIAGLLDAGARIGAEIAPGSLFEATPGNWRIGLTLSLLGVNAPPVIGDTELGGLADLLRAPPLMAENAGRGEAGDRAVMLAGPAAGWQRHAAEWVPPGNLPWPSSERVATNFRLVEGSLARRGTAEVARRAAALGLPLPALPDLPRPEPHPAARPPERPRLLHEGVLRVPDPGAPRWPLAHLSLRRAPDHRRGPLTVLVLDRADRVLGPLPRDLGGMVARLLEEGYALDIVALPPGPRERPGGLLIPYALRLRGDDPPGVARRRLDLLRMAAEVLPEGMDAELLLGDASPRILDAFVKTAFPLAHRNGGRLAAGDAAWLLEDAARGFP